ncbi:MAG: NAD(P)/FAD-dependent oxidoreductase [Spirochaetales bacterium]|nr:NAD(P)/FAD-dependent oxidoreductase [Spirochaetales bacterium]
MADRQYDVIVVGAGCAGPAAARQAAELGLKTLLIEKARVPGEKNVSGTCLNTAALSDPDLHYLLDGPVEREIREMRTYHIAPDRTTVFHEIPSKGILLLSIRRDHFDAWHTEAAQAAGAEVRLATAVTDVIEENGAICGVVTEHGEALRAKVVIDAGGVNSMVGRKAGLIPKREGHDMILYVTVAVHLGRETVDQRFGDCIEYYLAPGVQHKTWPWIFPKGEVVTLGTGGYLDDELIGKTTPSVNTYMQNFLDLPVVAKRLEGGRIVSWGLHLEFDESLEQTVRDGLILTGEAGGFVAPFLGEGMPEAFFTGIYAARAAAAAIAANDLSRASLEGPYQELLGENLFLQAFRHVAAMNKRAILSKPDEEIVAMMQNVVMGGGFITNVLHTNWMRGAAEGDLAPVQEAYEFMEFVQPYREIGGDFEAIYNERKAQAKAQRRAG